MGLFSTPTEVDPRLGIVAIASQKGDLKKIEKAQSVVLASLEPDETVLFVAPDTEMSTVWTFTDQRLLVTSGPRLQYELPLSKIAGTELKYKPVGNGRAVRYFVNAMWYGGPLGTVDRKYFNDSGFLGLQRFNGEQDVQVISRLIDGRIERLRNS